MVSRPSILIIGASRGLGLAMAEEFLSRGWRVLGTARKSAGTKLHRLRDRFSEKLEIETLDITETRQIADLRQRLGNSHFDLLFVNAGILTDTEHTVAKATTEGFNNLMITNALGPLRVLEELQDLVPDNGTIAVMSSGLASITENTDGVWDGYSASKAALVHLTRILDIELRPQGIRVNAVAPQLLDTPRNRALFPAEVMAHAVAPEAIAGVIAFLVSDAAAAVSGAILPAYGA